MNLKEKVEKEIIKNILKMLPRMSEKNLIRATYLVEKLPQDEGIRKAIRIVREYFEKGHPSVKLAKRIWTQLHPNCLNKLVENFFINACFISDKIRKEIKEKEGFHIPWFFVISPTMKCNLRCQGCSVESYKKDEDLSKEVWDKILDEAKSLGIYFITVQGGETFVRKDMLDIYASHPDMYFQVYSNGTLIDKKMAKRLQELGNVEVNLSVEGFEKETDLRRGKGVWRKVMEAMDNLREAGVMFGFSVTQTRLNTDIITSDEFFKLMIEKGCYIGWFFHYIPLGKDPDLSLVPLPSQRNKLREKLKEVREALPLFVGDFWNDGPFVQGCIAGARQYCHINHRGDVEACAFCHFAVDNIKSGKSLKEIFNSPFFKEMREKIQWEEAISSYSDNLLTPCQIIDQPWVLRELVEKYHAYSTDGAGDVLLEGKAARFLDEYSRQIHALYDKIWEEDPYYKEIREKIREKRRRLFAKVE